MSTVERTITEFLDAEGVPQGIARMAVVGSLLRFADRLQEDRAEEPVALGRVHDEMALFLRTHVGTGETPSGEALELASNADGCPLVRYRGRFYSLSWQEIVHLAVTAIDDALAAEAGGES